MPRVMERHHANTKGRAMSTFFWLDLYEDAMLGASRDLSKPKNFTDLIFRLKSRKNSQETRLTTPVYQKWHSPWKSKMNHDTGDVVLLTRTSRNVKIAQLKRSSSAANLKEQNSTDCGRHGNTKSIYNTN